MCILECKGYLCCDLNCFCVVNVCGVDDVVLLLVIEVVGLDVLLEFIFVFVLGCIVVGGLIFVEEVVEDVFLLLCELVGEGILFLFKVIGDLMVEVVICDGDWVVV